MLIDLGKSLSVVLVLAQNYLDLDFAVGSGNFAIVNFENFPDFGNCLGLWALIISEIYHCYRYFDFVAGT